MFFGVRGRARVRRSGRLVPAAGCEGGGIASKIVSAVAGQIDSVPIAIG